MTLRRAGIALAITATLAAGQARALSCLQPDAKASFAQAAASEARYVVAQGAFGFDRALLPGNGQIAPPKPFQVHFAGKLLTRAGFTNPLSVVVTVELSCAASWCGTLTPDRDTLVFIEQRPDGLYLAIGPCPVWVFENPDRATLRQMTACINGDC